MSVSISGPDCCAAEAYVGADSGTGDRVRRSSEVFNIPTRQKILLTVNVSAAKGQTVHFNLNLTIGMDGSGIIVTPPRPTPTPTPTPTPGSGVVITPPDCTDLAVISFSVAGQTGLTKTISGNVLNLSRRNRYLGGARSQWVEVLDITDEPMDSRLVRRVGFVRFTQIGPQQALPFSVVQNVRESRRTRYRVRIGYAPSNATNSLNSDDDCNSSNNTTTREMVGGGIPLDDDLIVKPKPKP